jgi:putative membrane protein
MATLREKYPLLNSKPIKKTISGGLIIIICFLIFFVALFASAGTGALRILLYLIPLFLLIIIICKYIFEVFYMKLYFYDMVGKNLIIRKGVFSRNEITLPINRLQDVYVDQDILDRMFGLYDVHVSSATMISGNLSHIDGIDKKAAEEIKQLILSSIHKENE